MWWAVSLALIVAGILGIVFVPRSQPKGPTLTSSIGRRLPTPIRGRHSVTHVVDHHDHDRRDAGGVSADNVNDHDDQDGIEPGSGVAVNLRHGTVVALDGPHEDSAPDLRRQADQAVATRASLHTDHWCLGATLGVDTQQERNGERSDELHRARLVQRRRVAGPKGIRGHPGPRRQLSRSRGLLQPGQVEAREQGVRDAGGRAQVGLRGHRRAHVQEDELSRQTRLRRANVSRSPTRHVRRDIRSRALATTSPTSSSSPRSSSPRPSRPVLAWRSIDETSSHVAAGATKSIDGCRSAVGGRFSEQRLTATTRRQTPRKSTSSQEKTQFRMAHSCCLASREGTSQNSLRWTTSMPLRDGPRPE